MSDVPLLPELLIRLLRRVENRHWRRCLVLLGVVQLRRGSGGFCLKGRWGHVGPWLLP